MESHELQGDRRGARALTPLARRNNERRTVHRAVLRLRHTRAKIWSCHSCITRGQSHNIKPSWWVTLAHLGTRPQLGDGISVVSTTDPALRSMVLHPSGDLIIHTTHHTPLIQKCPIEHQDDSPLRLSALQISGVTAALVLALFLLSPVQARAEGEPMLHCWLNEPHCAVEDSMRTPPVVTTHMVTNRNGFGRSPRTPSALRTTRTRADPNPRSPASASC